MVSNTEHSVSTFTRTIKSSPANNFYGSSTSLLKGPMFYNIYNITLNNIFTNFLEML